MTCFSLHTLSVQRLFDGMCFAASFWLPRNVFRIGFWIIGQAYITPTQLMALILIPPAKMEGKKKQKILCNNLGSRTLKWPFSNSASSSASVSSLVAFGWFPFPWRTRFFHLAARTSLDLENSLSLRMLIRLALKIHALKTSLEAAQWTRFVLGAILFMEINNLDKRRSSSLAGMLSIALDSFSDSQNFFHAFKSLLVLYWVFLD